MNRNWLAAGLVVLVLVILFFVFRGGITGNVTFADSIGELEEEGFLEGVVRAAVGWLFDDAPAENEVSEIPGGCSEECFGENGDPLSLNTICKEVGARQWRCKEDPGRTEEHPNYGESCICDEDYENEYGDEVPCNNNGVCEWRDNFETRENCPDDCGQCNNDGICDTQTYGESMENCPSDCKHCVIGNYYEVNSKTTPENIFAPNIPLNPPIELPDGSLITVVGPNKGCTIDKPFCYKKFTGPLPLGSSKIGQTSQTCVACVPSNEKIGKGNYPKNWAKAEVGIGCSGKAGEHYCKGEEDPTENYCGPYR